MKTVFDIVPGLKLKTDAAELFKTVKLSGASQGSDGRTVILHIDSPRLIPLSDLREAEAKISEAMFRNACKVKFQEHYSLAADFSLKEIYDSYFETISDEISSMGILYASVFNRAEKEFEDNRMILRIHKDIISEERSKDIQKYLTGVFRDRFGIEAEVATILTREKAAVQPDDNIETASAEDNSAAENSITEEVSEPSAAPSESRPEENAKGRKKSKKSFIPNYFRTEFNGNPVPISEITDEIGEVIVHGLVMSIDERSVKNDKRLIKFAITDFTDSITGRVFAAEEDAETLLGILKPGAFIRIKANAEYDARFEKDVVLGGVKGLRPISDFRMKRTDSRETKRVELHCHTKMSEMDGIAECKDLIKLAADWGHKAIAITDIGTVQSFPDAMNEGAANGIKIIYGCEGFMVDDLKPVVLGNSTQDFSGDFVVFDIETTGFSSQSDRIIEIGAVRFSGLNETGRFSEFVNPQRPIPFRIERLTGISDAMVAGADTADKVIPRFMEFCEGAVLVAHNAEFDTGFIRHNCEVLGIPYDHAAIDTLPAARTFVPGLKNYQLQTVAEALECSKFNHHRAVDDAGVTAEIFVKLVEIFRKNGIKNIEELGRKSRMPDEAVKRLRPSHIILLAKNDIGRINLYRLISESNIHYFHRHPLMPKSLITKYREGLLIGAACQSGDTSGDLFEAVMEGRSEEEISRLAGFYDYFEIQPAANNAGLLEDKDGSVESLEDLNEINKKIVSLGDRFGKLVCAAGDVHYLEPEDEIYRRIIMYGKKGAPSKEPQPSLYFKTTNDMLNEFSYLGPERAEEVVVTNTNKIANMIEPISPVRPDKCPPEIENSDVTLREICYNKAHELYGENIPAPVKDRLERELNSIIKNGFAVMYIIAQKLVWKSLEDGYLVGSRGSVGSSFVAFMAGITEVNSLHAHYRCPNCFYTDFDSDYVRSFSGRSGCDMEDRLCPVCGQPLIKDGHDIPFETFLGFKGNKEPDIDLNFSSEYQSRAHAYTEVLFGHGYTYRAGTISTLKEKTAFGYVLHYLEDKNIHKRRCEIERIAKGCEGVKRSTGQHPGGIVVLPHGEEINTFTPVQYPANDSSNPITTHFDYHKIEENLLKLDQLGHDDPTMIHMLEQLTGIDCRTIPMDDQKSLSLFQGLTALGITPDDIGGTEMGTYGIPEFNTDFAMQMLKETKPTEFSDLVRIAGLSHGTDVWIGNAQDLINSGTAVLRTAICTRDDIMIYLINQGLDNEESFKIMEAVRKGKVAKGKCGEWGQYKEDMLAHNVPDWYVDSCEKIKYMFPKAHAVAYVMMGMRIAWYKINHPLAFYAAFFTIRTDAFDYGLMVKGGKEGVDSYLKENRHKAEGAGKNSSEATNKELAIIKDMRIVQEYYARGFEFLPIDLYESDAVKFKISDGKLRPPFTSIEGMGTVAAQSLAAAAKKGRFISKDELKDRGKVSSTVIEKMSELGLLDGMPQSSQLSIFDII